jgi:hypothetical protein
MLEDDEKVAIQAYEFWCSISDEEMYRVQNGKSIFQLCERALDMLIEVINTHMLTKNNLDEDDLESWNTVRASSALLENLSLCTSDKLIQEAFNFIGKYLTSPDPKIRDSALIYFGSILPSQSQKLKNTIADGLQTILPLLSDSNTKVKVTVAWCMKKMCQHHASCFANSTELLNSYMKTVYENLHNKPKVIIFLCDSLHHLVLYLNKVGNNQLSSYLPSFVGELLNIAFKSDAYDVENNVALSAIYALGSFIDCAPPQSYDFLCEFFPNVVNAFESTFLDKNCYSSDEMRKAYQGYLATLISSFLLERKVPLTQEQADHLFRQLTKSFTERNSIYEEGIIAISSLALALGPGFISYIKDFGGFLLWGIGNWQDASICKACINGISDVIRSLREQMEPYIHHLLTKILDILEVYKSNSAS